MFRGLVSFSRAFSMHVGPSDAACRTVRRVLSPRPLPCAAFCCCRPACTGPSGAWRGTVRRVLSPRVVVCAALCCCRPAQHRTVRRSPADRPALVAAWLLGVVCSLVLLSAVLCAVVLCLVCVLLLLSGAHHRTVQRLAPDRPACTAETSLPSLYVLFPWAFS